MSSTPTDFNDMQTTHGKARAHELIRQIVQAGLERIERGDIAGRAPALEGVESPPEIELPPLEAYADEVGTKIAQKAAPGADSPDKKSNKKTGKKNPTFNDWRDDLRRNSEGQIKPWAYNIILILSNDPAWRSALGYCDFSYRIIKHCAPLNHMRTGEWEDSDTARVKEWLAANYYFNPSRGELIDALIVVAQQHRFHPVRDYLNGLIWDGQDRLDYWLADIMEARGDSHYLAASGRMFLVGAVARVMQPGCKMDTVLILEGEQGKGKSSVIGALFGDWYSDAPLMLGDKDAYQNIQGVWGIELAELDSFNRAESTTAKMFFSQRRDRYRPSYGQMAQDFPRQCVFAGTTNQDEYLKDYSGNRRYWPVYCCAAHADLMRDQRDQLWAEAVHRYQRGERWWPDDANKNLFEDEQDARLQVDPWHYPVERFLREWLPSDIRITWVTADEVLTAIGRDTSHASRADQTRLAPIMKALGWHKTRKLISVKPRIQKHVYERPADWERDVPVAPESDDGPPF